MEKQISFFLSRR